MDLVTKGKMDNPGFTQYLLYSGQKLEFGIILFILRIIDLVVTFLYYLKWSRF